MAKAAAKKKEELKEKELSTSTDKTKFRPKGIAIEDIIYYAEKNLTDEEIAIQLGCNRTNITRRLAEFGYCRKSLERYKQGRANIKTYIQSKMDEKIVSYLTDPDAKIESMRDLKEITIAKCAEYDKERIERGQDGSDNSISIILNIACKTQDKIIDITVDKSVDNT